MVVRSRSNRQHTIHLHDIMVPEETPKALTFMGCNFAREGLVRSQSAKYSRKV